jgi:hypothetical protein
VPLCCSSISSTKFSATLARWFTESNRLIHAVTDCQFVELILNRDPGLSLPSETTIARDIEVAFERSVSHITELLKVC